MRTWIHEIEKSGQGPDHFLHVSFAPSDAPALLQWARRNPPPSFSRVVDEESWKTSRRREHGHHDLFCYDQSRQWSGSLLEIRDGSFWFERDFGGVPDESALIETRWALEIMRAPGFSLARWEVAWGGQGYGDGAMAQGVSLREFEAYLQIEGG